MPNQAFMRVSGTKKGLYSPYDALFRAFIPSNRLLFLSSEHTQFVALLDAHCFALQLMERDLVQSVRLHSGIIVA